MKSIYFKDNQKKSPLKALLNFWTHGMVILTPGISAALAKKVLCNPYSKRKYEFKTKIDPTEFSVETKLGKVAAYHFANHGEKHILLTHGWADNSARFSELINSLNSDGFDVWTFDHIGHGKSEGSVSHLFGYIDGLEGVLNLIESNGFSLNGIVTHSMGGAAVMNSQHTLLNDVRRVFVSAPATFFEDMYQKISQIGISQSTVTNLLKRVSREYKGDWEKLRPANHISTLTNRDLFIHDVGDRVTNFTSLKEMIEGTEAKLNETENLGHLRLLKDSSVIESIGNHFRI